MVKRIIVDQEDNVIGAKERKDVDLSNDIYRVAALWLTNSAGQILIAQRGLMLNNSPGLWGPSVAGTVDEDAPTYEGCIVKETMEEIGLADVTFTRSYKKKVTESNGRMYFGQIFTAVVDQPEDKFVIDAREVNQVKWVDVSWLYGDLRENPSRYLENMEKDVARFL